MPYIDLTKNENDIKLKVVDQGDGTYSLSTAITVSGSGTTVVIAPTEVISGAKSGQVSLSGAGTAIPLHPSLALGCPVLIKAKTTNTGLVYVGNDGANSVSNTTGFVLAAGDLAIFDRVENLNTVYGVAAVAGEGICWLAMDV